jgi:hypothetical protein
MKSYKNRNRKATLRLIPTSYPNPILIGGIVLGVIAGILLVVFVVSPLVSAACDLIGGFWTRVCNAVGPV